MEPYFSDLHCHSTLFSYNRGYRDTWYERYFPVFPAQGNFAQLARGNVRVVMVSLYPIEQGFVTARLLGLGTGAITDLIAKVVVAMPRKRADEIQDYNHDYFDDLLKEIDFLQASADPVRHKVFTGLVKRREFRYRIVSNFTDLQNLLNLDEKLNPGQACEDTIAVILTIEGAHSLGVGQRNTLEADSADLEMKLRENIARLKKAGPPGQEGAWCPFFITLSHHFWNQLGGHSVSLWKVIRKVLDQTPGINHKITVPGMFVIDELLSTSNGRRILIDCAHMSIKVRRWYYDYIEQKGDHIPVIVSHTGVNGIATMAEAEMKGEPDNIHDVADQLYSKSEEFNPWDVFLSDEEIIIIHRSEGIIGLNLDQRIMMGLKTLHDTKKKARFKSPGVARSIWMQPLLKQVLHIARHIQTVNGNPAGIWDNISIGSDFNGMITPIKAFKKADKFPALYNTMLKELMLLTATDSLLTGKTEPQIREIVDKIMWRNNLEFLKKHFQ